MGKKIEKKCNLIPVKNVVFKWSESGIIGHTPKVVNTIDEANAILSQIAEKAPKGGAYNKTMVEINFEDGEQFVERIDVQHSSVDINGTYRNLGKFIETLDKNIKNPKFTWVKPEHITELDNLVAKYDIHGVCKKKN